MSVIRVILAIAFVFSSQSFAAKQTQQQWTYFTKNNIGFEKTRILKTQKGRSYWNDKLIPPKSESLSKEFMSFKADAEKEECYSGRWTFSHQIDGKTDSTQQGCLGDSSSQALYVLIQKLNKATGRED